MRLLLRIMTIPGQVVGLIERFDRNRDAYRATSGGGGVSGGASGGASGGKTQVRRGFIDALLSALGWDLIHRQTDRVPPGVRAVRPDRRRNPHPGEGDQCLIAGMIQWQGRLLARSGAPACRTVPYTVPPVRRGCREHGVSTAAVVSFRIVDTG